jgi:hypothetical protein
MVHEIPSPRSGRQTLTLPPAPRALISYMLAPGVPLRSTPGFMLSPAPQAEFEFIAAQFLSHFRRSSMIATPPGGIETATLLCPLVV